MAIAYRIDYKKRLVSARGLGTLKGEDIFAYQREVWSRPEVAGFHEVMDMREVEHIVQPSSDRIRELVALAAQMDDHLTSSKFAIVATDDLAFGLGRMYQTHRELTKGSNKEVAVFRTMEEALQWLGIEGQRAVAGGEALTNKKIERIVYKD